MRLVTGTHTHTQQKTIHCHQYPLIESICPSLKASFWLVESPLLTIKPPWLMVKSHQKSIKKILFMVQSHYIPIFDDEIHRVSRNSRPSATLKFVGSFAAKSRRIIRRGSQTCRWEPPRAPRAPRACAALLREHIAPLKYVIFWGP